ncbi:MAG: hypothetical protein H6739_04435 [Alphaproteobacteria bacterium]|nr:hypothetical protein [Alphaproteobacteria bacterium]
MKAPPPTPRRWPVVVVLLALGCAGLGWFWEPHCYDVCDEAEAEASRALDVGDEPDALRIIDDADATCSCMRFTEGDEPPQYGTVRVALQRLREAGRHEEARRALDAARGPILLDFARETEP